MIMIKKFFPKLKIDKSSSVCGASLQKHAKHVF